MKYCNFQSIIILVATNLPNAARAFGEDDLQAEVGNQNFHWMWNTILLSLVLVLVLSNLYILHILIPSSSHTSLIGCPNEEGEFAAAERWK